MDETEKVPTLHDLRYAWWMHTDNPADNEGASDEAFDRGMAAHDAEVRAAQREADAALVERGHWRIYPSQSQMIAAAIRGASDD